LTNLQQNIGRKILVNKSQNEKFEKLKKLKAARNIGIVYAVNEIDNNLKNKIIHYFEAEGKKVYTLGFVNDKNIDNYLPNFKEHYFCCADINFWKIPKLNSVAPFIHGGHDFLINLDIHGMNELQGISVLSSAHTRIGKYFEEFVFAHELMVKSNSNDSYGLFLDLVKYIK